MAGANIGTIRAPAAATPAPPPENRAAPSTGAARPRQQPQFLQVQGSQRQPPLVQVQVQAALVSTSFFIVFLLWFALRRIA
jgi:hypothetical protein